MAEVYILYSPSKDKYYIGSTVDIMTRLDQHVSGQFSRAYTKITNDWIIYFTINNLANNQARKIELHIKRMKSRKFMENLRKYPEMVQKLIAQYS